MSDLFERNPAVCVPLTGRTLPELTEECFRLAAKQPDLLEWRADFFEGLLAPDKLMDALRLIRQAAGAIPLLFTFRSAAEGGNPDAAMTPEEWVQVYAAVCESGAVRYVDAELSNPPEVLREIRLLSQSRGIRLILSFHDFKRTPDRQALEERFVRAKEFAGDAVKLAVMPQSEADVLGFMQAAWSLRQRHGIPMIAIAMGELGLVTRLFGWRFGSQLTFAVGERSSAPGQLPIEEVRAILSAVQGG